jgi:Protein of unknown function (DUF3810)
VIRLRLLLVASALAVAAIPLPPSLVEAWYSRRLYPALQAVLTPFSNAIPVALLDIAVVVLGAVLAIGFWRRARAGGIVRGLTSSVATIVTATAVVVLLFFALWGLNYRRVPLDQKLEYDGTRVTRDAALRLGDRALQEVNGLHAAAHVPGVGIRVSGAPGPEIEAAFDAAQRMLGSQRLAVPGLPKRSLLERYFRAAAIDGMTNPFFLEIILNPDTLPFERPFVLTHEWAHLAGYANEAEANFVAWLACTQGDAMARYSGWLAIFEHVAASLPKADRVALTSRLEAGPRRDLQEAAARYARASPVVRTAARDAYDTYLRANRVTEGVASYTAVVRLMLGAGLDDGRSPRLR